MKKVILFLIVLITAGAVKAQQDAAYTMYMFNGLYINPAYAGSKDVLNVMGIYRAQWVGLSGAPQTASIAAHTPFRRDQYAVGMVLTNDRLGLSNTFSVTPSFAYRLKIKQSRLAFGVQASFAYYNQRNDQAVLGTPGSDPVYAGNQNLFVPNFGFGVYWYAKRFFVGVSVPHLLPASLKNKTKVITGNEAIAKMYNAYIFSAGYVIGKEPSVVKFRPTIMVKWQQGMPKNIPQIDISPAFLFVDRLWLGITYRTGGNTSYVGQAIIPFMQVKITPQLELGYAYDAELTRLKAFNSGSHEIMLSYDFWYNKKRFVTPRYIKYF